MEEELTLGEQRRSKGMRNGRERVLGNNTVLL